MKTLFQSFLYCLAVLLLSSSCKQSSKVVLKSDYEANWESLKEHQPTPDWLYDAKFGIYFHWGIYCVPAFGSEWYPRFMFQKETGNYAYHTEHFGDPAEFGYHDFVPMFKAEYFDAAQWVDLFEKTGAKFAGPSVEHCDGFSMWASEINPWNVKDMGPKRDITAEIKQELDKRNMKMIATFHHARHLQRYADKPDETEFNDSHFPFIEGMPTRSEDPLLRILYGYVPEEEWLEKHFYGKIKEVIDGYEPDILWFDSWLDRIPSEWRAKSCAYYINEMAKKGKEVAIVRKSNDLPIEMSIENYEKSRKVTGDNRVWMADETISTNSWSYVNDMVVKTPEELIHVLVDIVSKNGIFLLNISPKADGTIPSDQQEVMLAIGKWLKNNGEAIYSSRPWYIYGEGPTKEPEGGFGKWEEFLHLRYTEDDVRYTTQGNTIYATILGNPQPGKEYLLQAFSEASLPHDLKVKKITLTGSKENIDWKQTPQGLALTVPQHSKQEAIVFKVETQSKK